MASRKRREIYNIFGTSMIDLLVGAMAMMALLWVMNVNNSGQKGAGDVLYPSFYINVSSYGNPHLKERFKLSTEIADECVFEGTSLPTGGFKFVTDQECENSYLYESENGTAEFLNADSPDSFFKIKYETESGFKSGFSLDISKQQYGSFEITFHMEACLASEPHYLQISGYSDKEIIENTMLFHGERKYYPDRFTKAHQIVEGGENYWISTFVKELRETNDYPDIFVFERRLTSPFGTPVTLKFFEDGSFEYEVKNFSRMNNDNDFVALQNYVHNF